MLAGRRALGKESQNKNTGVPRCWDPASGRLTKQDRDSDWVGLGGRYGNEWKRLSMTFLCTPDLEAGDLWVKTGQAAPQAGPGQGRIISVLLPHRQRH